MPQNYVPIFIFMAVIGVLLPLTLLAAKLVRPDNPSKTKLMPYECGIDPVSYTHLDVYKRQIQELKRFYDFDLDSSASHRLKAVSYTHLDVYKRQFAVSADKLSHNQ